MTIYEGSFILIEQRKKLENGAIQDCEWKQNRIENEINKWAVQDVDGGCTLTSAALVFN